jgi:heat shock protein HslJ
MKQIYLKFGLKLFVIIGLLNIGIFAQSDLSAARWNLTEINGRKVDNSKAYLEINENRLTGNAGCNRLSGEAKISRKNIKFARIATTKMFCGENGVMRLETYFTNALEKVSQFKKSGNNLSFYAGNRLILKFKAEKSD